MKRIVIIMIAVFTAGFLYADNRSAASYMLIDSFPEAAAKFAACGAAFYGVSYADENPAAIAVVDNYSWAAMHSIMPLSMYEEKASLAKVFDFGSLGLSFTHFNFGQVQNTGIDGNLGPVLNADTSDLSAVYISALYAKKFESFSIGFAAKGLSESLTGDPWYAFLADAGFIFEGVFVDDLNLGFSVLNLSAGSSGSALPLDIKTALSYDIKSKVRDQLRLTAAADYLANDDAIKAGLGFDYTLFDDFILRGGFSTGNMEKLKFTAGIGAKVMGLTFDYAFVPDANTGDTHKLSISGSFGKQNEQPDKPEGKGAETGESYAGYMKSGDYYYENRQYRQALKYYEYINLLYWKETEALTDRGKTIFYQKLGICYYNIKDNARALQYFERALYFDRENEILRQWIKLMK
jgi:tetratricopeptide (TPR) repeat protein